MDEVDRMLGFEVHARHLNADGEVIWEYAGHNVIANEGYEAIYDSYFQNTSHPTGGFKMALYTNALAALDKDSVYSDLTEHSGDGYARNIVERSATGFPTEGEDAGQRYLKTSVEVFTASGGTWTEVNGAALVDETNTTLISFKDFPGGRTLGSGDSLDVTLTLKRENPA